MRLLVWTAWVFALPAGVMSLSTSPLDKSALIAMAAYGALTFACGWIAARATRKAGA